MSSTPMRILVTAQAFSASGGAFRDKLGKLGCTVIDSEAWGPLTLDRLIDQARDCDAIVAATDPYCQAAFDALPRLKLVARCGIGVDSVDLASASEHGILVTNVPDAMTEVSIHAPNTPETKHMINSRAFEKMRRTAYLINTARGALVDPAALVEAVRRGQIAGAAMDVYEQEPLPIDDPLRSAPNLLLTPHNAFNSREAAVRMSQGCYEPILDILEGRIPKSVCNPEVLRSDLLRVKQWTL